MLQHMNKKLNFPVVFIGDQFWGYLGEPVTFVEVGSPVAVGNRNYLGCLVQVVMTTELADEVEC